MNEYCMHCMNVMNEDICTYCGKKANTYQAAPHHLMPGTVLNGKYIVGSALGEGGFGITYIGRDINLDIRVAIKEYFPSGVVKRNNTSSTEITALVGDAQTGFEKGKKSFLAEARTLAMFSSESGVVSVRDFFSENNTAYIVMEYLEGNNLKEYVSANGVLSFSQAFSLLSPIMTALTKIHKQGLIHRDISPDNLMILKDGTVKLLDFGAARNVGGADEKSLSIMLKPGFAPEEQYRSKGNQGPWTDVYALSSTMYKLITGVTPDDAMNRLFSDELKKPSEINSSVTKAQDEVILKGMAVQQSVRFHTIDELQSACASVLQSNYEVANNCDESDRTMTGEQYCSRTEHKNKTDEGNCENGRNNDGNGKENERKPASANENKADNQKKPIVFAFICSIVTGIIALCCLLITTSVAVNNDGEGSLLTLIIFTLIFAGASIFTGRYYFTRIDNKKRKPNIPCFIASILTSCAAVLTFLFMFFDNDESSRTMIIMLTLVLLIITVFFGYFYYPRLEKKTRKKLVKIYGIIAVLVVAVFIGVMVNLSLSAITIGDTNIKRNAESLSISIDIINDNDLAKLKDLKSLKSLEIIECFLDDEDVKVIGELTQLEKLSLMANTDITDVSPIRNLKGLTYLDISNTGVKDISCLSELKKLKSLNIDNTDVSDLSILSGFLELDTLYMNNLAELTVSTISLPAGLCHIFCSNDNIDNIEFLSITADTLITFSANNNKISDISILSSFNQLYTLELESNDIMDISSLPSSSLSKLDLGDNQISDISVLNKYSNGPYTLHLGNNQITDISALNDNSGIGIVELNDNQITDISALKDCFRIHLLDLSNNEISDISALQTIDELEILNLANNKIADITPLASCKKLHDAKYALDLSNNNISDITAIKGYMMEQIYLSSNMITDISPLSGCSNLEAIYANHNQITDIAPISALTKLRILVIVDNPITNLGNLSLTAEDSISGTSTLKLSYNEQIDWESLAQKEDMFITIYDATDRQKAQLKEYGFKWFSTTEELENETEEVVTDETSEPSTTGGSHD